MTIPETFSFRKQLWTVFVGGVPLRYAVLPLTFLCPAKIQAFLN
jgi:hypothetical protein